MKKTILMVSTFLAIFILHPTTLSALGNSEFRKSAGGEASTVWIGNTKTTKVEASMDKQGGYSLSYIYRDSYALLVNRIVIDTDVGRKQLRPKAPSKTENPDGTVTESDNIPISQALLEQMASSRKSVIYIDGAQGTIIIEMGTQGKANLRELLEYGEA